MSALARTALATVVAVAGLAQVSTASAASATQNPVNQIIGGTQADDLAVVQLQFSQNGGTYYCTGELISSQWVLTAQHCTENDKSMRVYVSNSTTMRGTARVADRWINSPNGDVALVHLPTPVTNVKPMRVTNGFTPRSGMTGVIEGYGLRSGRNPASHLYKANVSITGSSYDTYGGPAIHLQGIDGASNHGDSGGPLLVNGVIVGVDSTGDKADPGSDIHAGSNYANISASRQWIYDVSGI